MKPLSPNVLIQDRYLIVHLIGKGGMGEVYLAVDQRLGSAVALKRTFFSDDEMLANAFEREARILANLRHPILPKVSDHFIDGENQFLVMEHITGDDLSKRLEKTQQPFPLSWVLFWADQLLDALHYLHTHEPPIIHRDIKPQNLKLTNDNHIVLLDFGLSKNSVGETRTSSSGSIVGYTPHYAPMEQIRGTGTNAQSDLYSLAATVYQLITNAVPPDALTRADSLLSGLPDPIKPINELNKEVTPEVSEVILKGMDIRQDSRHSSAREMQKSLRDAYSKLQSAMTAQTIAFNVSAEEMKAATDGSSEAALPSVPLPDTMGDDIETSQEENFQNPTDSASFVESPVSDSYHQSGDSSGLQPSDIKTEVLLAGQSPAITAAQNGTEIPDDYRQDSGSESNSEYKNFETADNFEAPDAFTTNSGDSNDDGFALSSSTPLSSESAVSEGIGEEDAFEGVGGNGETAFFANIAVDEEHRSPSTFVPERELDESEEPVEATAPSSSAVPAKASGGKKFAVIAGVLALLFIVFGAIAGAGWILYDRGYFGGAETPLPTPEPTIEATPTASPTVEDFPAIDNSNSEIENLNSNSDVQVSGSNVNARQGGVLVQPSVKPTQSPPRGVITPPPTPRPTVKPTATPRKTPTPGGILQ